MKRVTNSMPVLTTPSSKAGETLIFSLNKLHRGTPRSIFPLEITSLRQKAKKNIILAIFFAGLSTYVFLANKSS